MDVRKLSTIVLCSLLAACGQARQTDSTMNEPHAAAQRPRWCGELDGRTNQARLEVSPEKARAGELIRVRIAGLRSPRAVRASTSILLGSRTSDKPAYLLRLGLKTTDDLRFVRDPDLGGFHSTAAIADPTRPTLARVPSDVGAGDYVVCWGAWMITDGEEPRNAPLFAELVVTEADSSSSRN